MWNAIVGCGSSWLQDCAINNRLPSHVRQYHVQPPLQDPYQWWNAKHVKSSRDNYVIHGITMAADLCCLCTEACVQSHSLTVSHAKLARCNLSGLEVWPLDNTTDKRHRIFPCPFGTAHCKLKGQDGLMQSQPISLACSLTLVYSCSGVQRTLLLPMPRELRHNL